MAVRDSFKTGSIDLFSQSLQNMGSQNFEYRIPSSAHCKIFMKFAAEAHEKYGQESYPMLDPSATFSCA